MSVIVDLVLSLCRAAKVRWLPNRSIALNVLAIASSVAFLGFALAIYDGYRGKVERIIFTLTPHVTVRPGLTFTDEEAVDESETERCVKVCRGPSAVHLSETTSKTVGGVFGDDKLKILTDWLASVAPAGTSASRVLFDEVPLRVQKGQFATEGPRTMRVLGVDMIQGTSPSPRIDLAFGDHAVERRFWDGAGIVISDALASEIARADGAAVVPGVTTLAVAAAGRPSREVPVIGIHHLGIHSISRNLIIAPYRLGAELLGGAGDGPTYVGLTLANQADARDVAERLRDTVAGDGLVAVEWQSATDLYDQLELYRWIIVVALGLSIAVTAINTFVNVSILVMERVQHIGIMRAMGLGPIRLLTVFLGIGVLQSLLGTTLGYAAGIAAAYGLDDRINAMVRDFIPITEVGIVADPVAYAAILALVACVTVAACALAGRRALRTAIYANLRGS